MTTTGDSPGAYAPRLGMGVYEFARGYHSEAGRAPEYPLLFLPSAFMLSSTLAESMSGTRADTGLADWCGDNPIAKAKIYPEVLRTSKFSRHAIRVNVEQGILEQQGHCYVPNPHFSKKVPVEHVDASIVDRPLSTAYCLGQWCGQVNSTQEIYSTLGLTA